MKVALLIATAVMVVALSGAARASDQLVLRGYGTAVVDGTLAPGEWAGAGRYDFQANRAPAEGGGTVPATLLVMNDSVNLYLALRLSVSDIGYSSFMTEFFAPPPSRFGPGNDILVAQPTSFDDLHFHEISPNSWQLMSDIADGGSLDGTAAV